MSSIHPQPFEGAGKTYELKGNSFDGEQIHVEDFWDRVAGQSWMTCDGNPAAMIYGIRSGTHGLPLDNEVVYGKIAGRGHIVHVSELGEVRS